MMSVAKKRPVAFAMIDTPAFGDRYKSATPTLPGVCTNTGAVPR
jgi:hypothetical protein